MAKKGTRVVVTLECTEAITGKIISGIVAGEKTNLDLSAYSSKRFN